MYTPAGPCVAVCLPPQQCYASTSAVFPPCGRRYTDLASTSLSPGLYQLWVKRGLSAQDSTILNTVKKHNITSEGLLPQIRISKRKPTSFSRPNKKNICKLTASNAITPLCSW